MHCCFRALFCSLGLKSCTVSPLYVVLYLYYIRDRDFSSGLEAGDWRRLKWFFGARKGALCIYACMSMSMSTGNYFHSFIPLLFFSVPIIFHFYYLPPWRLNYSILRLLYSMILSFIVFSSQSAGRAL